MTKVVLPLVAVGMLLVPALYPSQSYALSDTAYVDPVSGTGTTCSVTAPCADIVTAQAAINNPGLIVVVHPGTFPPVTISQGTSISCHEGCTIDSSGGATAITVSALTTDTVSLSGVGLSGFGSGGTGLKVNSVAKIELKNVSISGNGVGIDFSPSSGTSSHLYLLDSEVRNASTRNIQMAPTSSVQASATITRTRVHHGNAGLVADATAGTGGVSVVISDSVFSFFNSNGVNVLGNAAGGAPSRVQLNGVTVSFSSGNCVASTAATAQAILYGSMITQCASALTSFSGGPIFSYGNNAIHFNTSDGVAPTSTPQK